MDPGGFWGTPLSLGSFADCAAGWTCFPVARWSKRRDTTSRGPHIHPRPGPRDDAGPDPTRIGGTVLVQSRRRKPDWARGSVGKSGGFFAVPHMSVLLHPPFRSSGAVTTVSIHPLAMREPFRGTAALSPRRGAADN
jgi:hypothetical protein